MQQRVNKPRPVKRMDVVAREQEQREHDEMLARARRASAKAQKLTTYSQSLLNEIGYLL